MKPLMMDFANRSRLPFGLAGMALMALVLAIASYWIHAIKSAELIEVQRKLFAVKEAKQVPRKITPESQARQREIASAMERLALPWGALFEALDAPSNDEVVLLELQPDVERSQVALTGEAKNMDALTRYVEDLQTQKIFRNVYLASHQVQVQAPSKPVRFVVRAQWLLLVNDTFK